MDRLSLVGLIYAWLLSQLEFSSCSFLTYNTRFYHLSGPGVYCGGLNFDLPEDNNTSITSQARLLPYPFFLIPSRNTGNVSELKVAPYTFTYSTVVVQYTNWDKSLFNSFPPIIKGTVLAALGEKRITFFLLDQLKTSTMWEGKG